MYLNGSPEMPPRLLPSKPDETTDTTAGGKQDEQPQPEDTTDTDQATSSEPTEQTKQAELATAGGYNGYRRLSHQNRMTWKTTIHLLRSRTRKSAGERQRQRRKKSSARALHHRSVRRQMCCWQRECTGLDRSAEGQRISRREMAMIIAAAVFVLCLLFLFFRRWAAALPVDARVRM